MINYSTGSAGDYYGDYHLFTEINDESGINPFLIDDENSEDNTYINEDNLPTTKYQSNSSFEFEYY